MAPTFARSDADLWVLTAELPAGMGSYQVVFVPVSADGVPTSLTLAQTWQDHPGTYAFLASAPAIPTTFAAGFEWFRQARPGLGAVWLANPDDPAAAWRASWLSWQLGEAGTATTVGLSAVQLRNLGVWVAGGSTVALAVAQDALTISPVDASGLYLTAESGAATLPASGSLGLPFGDLVAGTLGFELPVDNTGLSHPPDVDRLDIGLRYFQPTTTAVIGGVPAWQTASQRFPLLSGPLPDLTLGVRLDPLFPTLPTRTLLGLAEGTGFGSTLLSTTGRPITLTAGGDPDNPCGFVPAVRALTVPSRSTDPYYLTPVGAFTVGEGRAEQQLMCGTSGVEYLTVSALAGSVLYLVCGHPGYAATSAPTPITSERTTPAPSWRSRRTGADARSLAAVVTTCGGPIPPPPSGGGSSTLTGDATTSWAYLVGPQTSAAVYRAQSDSATLYQPIPTTGPLSTASAVPTLLDYLELSGTQLPAAFDSGASPPTLFPMVGLAGLVGDPSAAQQLELLAISPARRAAIAAIAAAAVGPIATSVTSLDDGTPLPHPALAGTTGGATTPQGLYATFVDGAMSLLLGKSGADELVLGNLAPPLVQAFQSSQLFLVASDRDALGRLATLTDGQGRLRIALNPSDTWTFDVFAEGWAERGTAVLLKFAGRSLLELLGDVGTWSLGEVLNGGSAAALAAEQQSLLSFCCAAITRAANGDDDFVAFADVVTDPSWNGILVLNCAVPLDGLPEQMSGVAAGIDPALFRAHHLGITVTPVQAPAGVLTPQDSSLFGLVAYEDPADLVGTQADYRFKVNSLTARFVASAVVGFASRIELLVNALFGDAVELVGGGHGNNLVLDGVYQRQGASSSYAFTTIGDTLFTVSSGAVLAAVDVTRAEFVTVVAADAAERQKISAESRFVLSGSLKFHDLEIDLFSFGDTADGKPAGQLAFADLAVDLTYDPADPPKSSVYAFDATRLTYDLAASNPRPGSLFDAFPLTLTSFVQTTKPAGGSGQTAPTPGTLGFLPVDVPLSQGAFGPPWFGLVANLSLGTAGALAAEAGFTASLLAAWTPGKALNVAFGLKLPGTGGPHKLLSLESVLKLKIADLSLRKVGTAYVLALHDISLSLLSLSFPSSGQTQILLFADPGGQTKNTLAWYGGYAQDPPKPKPPALGSPDRVPGQTLEVRR
jgi:hypothetical protein